MSADDLRARAEDAADDHCGPYEWLGKKERRGAFVAGFLAAHEQLPGRDEIARLMQKAGWTCEYHEPDPRCSQCRSAHLEFADSMLSLIHGAES